MKKRFFALIVLVVLVALCLCACNAPNYNKINKMANEKYSKIEITVKTTMDGEELKSTFVVQNTDDKSTVTYSVQLLTKISADALPENYITTYSGSVTVQNGKIVEENGDPVSGVDFPALAENVFHFHSTNFENAQMDYNKFAADVTNPNGFMGADNAACKDMTVSVMFGDYLQNALVKYVSANGAAVTIEYTFTH